MPVYTNQLIHEKSPYLLQHAHNPVDWHPWGEEAFALARKLDKPVFLSIGYSTCHWCHVMEHESFDDPEIAKLLNNAFVCIKVDREERPDVDNIYMTVCQMMSGSGGWPLSLFLTPDRLPFHAATYIPPEQRFGHLGLKQIVPRLATAWREERQKLLESAGRITDYLLQHQAHGGEGDEIDPAALDKIYNELMNLYDAEHGGFGRSPKFPVPHRLLFLMRHGQADGMNAVEHTLKAMRMGGIFDHIGFGFHRYSTDSKWLQPHFEKMLYDQALLALAYIEAYQITQKPFYRDVSKEVLEYVMRDMTHPGGGFYTAEDADSEGEEGRFYLWTSEELNRVLDQDAGWISSLWNIKPKGNFRDEASGQWTGKNIPHLTRWPNEQTLERLKPIRSTLFKVREKRVHPLKDTKILADWNGLMITAFSRAGDIFDDVRYTAAARKAFQFVENKMCTPDERLWHCWREGEAIVPGQLEDYAFMIHGLLALYENTLDPRLIERALAFNQILNHSFKDEENGGYFMTGLDAEALIVRPKEIYDGALPSGNSVQFGNLLQLARLTGREELEKQADQAARAFYGVLSKSPANFTQAMLGFQHAFSRSEEIVVVGERGSTESDEFLKWLRQNKRIGRVVLFKNKQDGKLLSKVAPFTEPMRMMDGKTTAYVCRSFTCAQPVQSLQKLVDQLSNGP